MFKSNNNRCIFISIIIKKFINSKKDIFKRGNLIYFLKKITAQLLTNYHVLLFFFFFPFKIAMEEKTLRLRLVLLLCLLSGMLMGHSIVDASKENDDCYHGCLEDCYLGTNGDYRGTLGCASSCSSICAMKVDHKYCLLFWCWKLKGY